MGRPTEAERFWAKVNRDGDCWLWTAGRGRHGYGTFRPTSSRTMVKAHRWSWIEANGPVPVGLELDHLCRTPACVRPDHLEAVTHQENVQRAKSPTCAQGHLLETYGGERQCKQCRREYLNRYQNEKRREAGAVPGGPGAAARAKTHCKHGHLYDEASTGRDRRGGRFCLVCQRLRNAARRQVPNLVK